MVMTLLSKNLQLVQALPVFTFANQAGLDLLETTLVALQDITLEKMFDDHGRKALFSEFPQIMQQVWEFPMMFDFLRYHVDSYKIVKDQIDMHTILISIFNSLVVGLCLSSRWHLFIKHGQTSFLREGGGMEGTE